MRARLLFLCSLTVLMITSLLVSPSLAADPLTVGSVTGQVTDSGGAPIPNATVSLVDASYLEVARTTSDSSGNFTFSNANDRGTGYLKVIVSYVKDGKTYNLTKTPASWYSANTSAIRIAGEETSFASYPPLPESTNPHQAFSATGQVTDANRRPLPGAEVHLYDGIYKEIGVTTSGANGNFSFDNVYASSPGCKVQVFYKADGKVYQTYLQNTIWYPTDSGRVAIYDARLYDYPEPKTGYVWGIITNGNASPVSGEVYLANSKRHFAIETSESGNTVSFVSEVPAGEYTVYAVHKDASSSLESRPVKVLVNPSRNYLEYPSLILVADQPVAPVDVKPVTLFGAVVLGAALIAGLWYALRRL